MQKIWLRLALALCALVVFIVVNNMNMGTRPVAPSTPVLLAHRGISQQFDRTGLRDDTCTAARMLTPTHGYLENSLPSIQASFAAGADVVEIDVHPTTDGQFAVFHDWTLNCRTDGHGVTRQHSMAELKRLDIGYGYTADGGRTFPFRGKGIGLMPSLAEVLQAFPHNRFLVNIKSNDEAEGALLAKAVKGVPNLHERLMFYGADKPIARLRDELSLAKTMSRGALKSCLIRYAVYGWTGIVPSACANMLVFVPLNVAPWLWGWPERFLTRMGAVNSEVFVVGPFHGGFLTGIDTPEHAAQLPPGFSGGILTNELETMAPVWGRKKHVMHPENK